MIYLYRLKMARNVIICDRREFTELTFSPWYFIIYIEKVNCHNRLRIEKNRRTLDNKTAKWRVIEFHRRWMGMEFAAEDRHARGNRLINKSTEDFVATCQRARNPIISNEGTRLSPADKKEELSGTINNSLSVRQFVRRETNSIASGCSFSSPTSQTREIVSQSSSYPIVTLSPNLLRLPCHRVTFYTTNYCVSLNAQTL